MNALKIYKKRIGIYSAGVRWEEIFGNRTACTEFSSYPLWYANYDNKTNFIDFKTFGGWKKPNRKQFQQNVRYCGAGFDINYYP